MRSPAGLVPTLLIAAVTFISACGTPSPDGTRGQETSGTTGSSRAPYGMNPDLLNDGVDIGEMYILSDGQRDHIGTATSTIERVSVGSTTVLRLVLHQKFTASEMVDTLEVDAATLRPIRYRNVMGDVQSIVVDYGEGGQVHSTFTRMGQTTTRDTVLTDFVLDAAEFQPLIAALPLAEGYTKRFPVYHYEAGARTVEVRVAGSTPIPYAGGQREAWIVEYEGAPGRVVTLAIDVEDRRMLRAASVMDQGRKFEQVTR